MLLRARHFPDSVVHGFTTREGGVSVGRYASMNLGNRWGDEPEAVAENLRRLARAAEFRPEQLVRVTQVHGDTILAAHEVDANSQADAIWRHHEHPGEHVVGVMTADCVPLLLVDRQARVCAAVHSGWRGTVAGIAAKTVALLVERAGIAPGDLLAAIGPCIELDAFEVGPEVAEEFDPAFVLRRPDRKPHVDLVAAVRAQLEQAGVPGQQIERVGGCTHANPDSYFSYRREGAGQGQHLAFIGLPASG
ncbi:peptidoglycan editing factor PgeF [Nannocystaceae bacterium ST9]